MATSRPTFRGAVLWSYLMNGGEKAIFALVTFVLASMLGPSDFGTVSMAMVYILFIQMFLEQGLCLALIQRKDIDAEHLDSVFWMVMVAGLALVGISVGLSGWWARVNHLPTLAPVIRWLSISIVIESLTVVQRAVLHRDMNFKSLSLRSNAAAAVAAVVGLGMALAGFGVWALVGLKLAEDVAALALLWTLSSWRPRSQFSLLHLKQLFGFSVASLFTKVGVFVNRYSTGLLIGLFFGPVAVGVYRLAERVVNTLLDTTTTPLQMAAFSQFSRLQNHEKELRQSALQCLRLGATLTIPSLAGLALVSSPLMAVMGHQWAPAAHVLQILCALGIVLTFTRFTETLLPALSRPHYLAILKWAECIVTVALLLGVSLALKQSSVDKQVIGIALTQFVVGALVFGPILFYLLIRLSGISLSALISIILPPLVAAAAAAAAVLGVSQSGLLHGARPAAVLAADVVAGGLAGIAALLVADRHLKTDILAFKSGLFGAKQAGFSCELLPTGDGTLGMDAKSEIGV
jgi:O-antigen/teichoic acid export membrane protein